MSWVLRLLAFSGCDQGDIVPTRKVAGLTLPLRLALSAQAAGAEHIELAEGALEFEELLRDKRLHIPVYRESAAELKAKPEPYLTVEAPGNLVVHRDLFRDLVASGAKDRRNLLAAPIVIDRPFGFQAQLVTSKTAARKAETALLYSLRKPLDGWTSTYLNRHISLFFTRYLAHTPLHPNQVSVGILAIGVIGAVLAAQGTYWTMLLGAFLFQSQSVLDGCDGELSRLTYRGSHMGEWLDTVGDDITNYGYFAGAAWGLYTASHSQLYLIAGAVTLLCGIISSGIEYRYLASIGSGDLLKYPIGIGKAPSAGDKPKGPIGQLLDAIAPLFKRDTFVFLTLLGAAAGLLGPFLFIFAAGSVGIFFAVIRAEIVRARMG